MHLTDQKVQTGYLVHSVIFIFPERYWFLTQLFLKWVCWVYQGLSSGLTLAVGYGLGHIGRLYIFPKYQAPDVWGDCKLIGLLRLAQCWMLHLEINSQTCSAEDVYQICTTLLGWVVCVCVFEHIRVCIIHIRAWVCAYTHISVYTYMHLCACVCARLGVCMN